MKDTLTTVISPSITQERSMIEHSCLALDMQSRWIRASCGPITEAFVNSARSRMVFRSPLRSPRPTMITTVRSQFGKCCCGNNAGKNLWCRGIPMKFPITGLCRYKNHGIEMSIHRAPGKSSKTETAHKYLKIAAKLSTILDQVATNLQRGIKNR